MGMRYKGFRRVRRQVCRRIRRRFESLGLADFAAYRGWLEGRPEEWSQLDALCRVTISRFYRNRRLYAELPSLLEELASAAGARALRVWSAGCASGEEPYSVVLAAERATLAAPIEVVASDSDPHMLARARQAEYPAGNLRELDEQQRDGSFTQNGEIYRLSPHIAQRVRFVRQDVRREAPDGHFDAILCRNLAFTYFDEETQRRVCDRFAQHSQLGSALIVGAHEAPPSGAPFEPWPGRSGVYRRVDV
jgi:chemotaxis protein methyltransferase CheR